MLQLHNLINQSCICHLIGVWGIQNSRFSPSKLHPSFSLFLSSFWGCSIGDYDITSGVLNWGFCAGLRIGMKWRALLGCGFVILLAIGIGLIRIVRGLVGCVNYIAKCNHSKHSLCLPGEPIYQFYFKVVRERSRAIFKVRA